MDTDETQDPRFSAFLTCRSNKGGLATAFHIAPLLEAAQEWRKQSSEKKPSNDNSENKEAIGLDDSAKSADLLKPKINQDFSSTLSSFVKSMRSFYDLVTINAAVRNVFPSIHMETEFSDYANRFLPKIDSHGDYTTYGIPEDKVITVNNKVKKFEHLKEGVESLPASILMGLVARFDANISGLVRFLLLSRKEKLSGSEKAIPVREVLAASSFEDLINDLVEDEIHSLMRGSHDEQIKYIEDNFSIKIRDDFDRWPDFIEIFERRNLAAHGEGIANNRYAKVCKRSSVPSNSCLNIGDPVILTDKYLIHATDTLLEFGILLIWWLWLKQIPSDGSDAYNAINDVTYDLILEKRHNLASRILNSTLKRKTANVSESVRRMMAINMANCYKKLKKDREFKEAISMFDWSASADHYKISVASLNQDYIQVCSLMSRVTDDASVGKFGFREWPVFDWVRDNDDVKSKFEEVFGEKMDIAHPTNENRKSETQSNPT